MKKTGISLRGYLLFPLIAGRPAVIQTRYRVLRTAPVVKFHARQGDRIRFETENAVYNLCLRPFPLAAIRPQPQALAA